ncbi:xanthine dehydrogenase accessory protein XdhC [Thalassotalea psychrophila]|uniref:Xanthine dehydrogenase accessory protein XdhC n=1 Tax=Thalassotalea psychrophila TaxID=3065647 RepID=A0ABY9TV77_9GAMM|nr:xanthine dehydrogenase accessory protein XdhC [Colwelliaceae bacterium SQ149]
MTTKMNWNSASYQLSKQGQAYVLVTLVGVSGSTPRNSGTKMVITADDIFDTIGGGHLEHKTIKHAKAMLAGGKNAQHLEHFQLGSNLGQCCGGNATVLFECFSAVGVNIMLFGAGHVGKALVPILAQLPCQVTWVDSREEQFPSDVETYHNVRKVVAEEPELEVNSMPENSYYIVMTHNHQMDFEISQAILKRSDFSYLGLIASDTKKRRFEQRFKHREIDPVQVARMNCPIGLEQVGGKLPMEVAVSIAGEVIHCYQQANKQKEALQSQHQSIAANDANTKVSKKRPVSQQGIHWQEFKQLLTTEESNS